MEYIDSNLKITYREKLSNFVSNLKMKINLNITISYLETLESLY